MNAFMLPQPAAGVPQAASAPLPRVTNAFQQRASGEPPKPLPAPTPQPYFSQSSAATSGNPMGNAFKAFATGLVGPERIGAVDAQHEAAGTQRATKALAWLQQAQAIPEAQRMDWTMHNAEAIARDTGQDPRKGMQNAFARGGANPYTDANLQQGIAALSAQLGQGPAAPEFQYFQGQDGAISQVNKGTGDYRQINTGTPKPQKTWDEVNGRIISTDDPTKVLADYSDQDQPSGADWQQFTDASGQLWEYQRGVPGTERKVEVPRGRVPGSGDGDGPQLTPFQQYQIARDGEADAAKGRAASAKTENAMYSLQEGVDLVTKLVGHDGFKTIFGAQGALPIIPGTAGADAMAMLDQIGGQAFLAGVETMRGTGPLSDNEGRKVATARTRLLNRGQSPEAAKIAAQEFTASMQRLLAAYEQESGIQLQRPAPPVQAQSGTPDFTVQQPPAGLPDQFKRAWMMGTPQARQYAWGMLSPEQQKIAMRQGAQPAPQAPAPQMNQPPPGINPDIWDEMTPEERAAFD